MPFPALLLIGGAVVAGGLGLGLSYDAKKTMNKANRTIEDAKDLLEKTQKSLSNKFNSAATQLGEIKKNFNEVCNSARDKIKFSKLGNDESFETFANSVNETVKDFDSNIASAIAGGLGAGMASAALAVGGVYVFGAASTGAAISSLSGAALTSSLTAWFGGGALAAGGAGVIGGTAALGGIIAGPALLIGGALLSYKADEALSSANNQYDKIKAECINAQKKNNKVIKKMKALQVALEQAQSNLNNLIHIYEENKSNQKSLCIAQSLMRAYVIGGFSAMELGIYDSQDDMMKQKPSKKTDDLIKYFDLLDKGVKELI